jgi:hypothetical protein
MPMQNGLTMIQWQCCERCGLMYPITTLNKQQGLLVCNVTCTDNLDNQYRPKQIADVLATPGEGSDERSEFFQGPGELVVF